MPVKVTITIEEIPETPLFKCESRMWTYVGEVEHATVETRSEGGRKYTVLIWGDAPKAIEWTEPADKGGWLLIASQPLKETP